MTLSYHQELYIRSTKISIRSLYQLIEYPTSDQMSFQTCWRCFSKSRIPYLSPIPVYPSFTTSAPVQGQKKLPKKEPPKGQKPAPRRGVMPKKGVTQKGTPATYIKKRKPTTESRPRKPAFGERTALRKRIILSNNNAIVVEDVPEFGAESVGDAQLHGQVVGLAVATVARLRAVEAFKRTQNWGLFRNPAMLVRRETIEYGRLFKMMSEEQESRRCIRRIIVGERGSGKSVILLQAMTMAFLKNWVVINLPEGTIPAPVYGFSPSFCPHY